MTSTENNENTNIVRLIRLQDVIYLTGRSRSRIYAELQNPDSLFPRPIKDGASTRWVEGEVVEWIRSRVARSRSGDA